MACLHVTVYIYVCGGVHMCVEARGWPWVSSSVTLYLSFFNVYTFASISTLHVFTCPQMPRASSPLELGFQTLVMCPLWVLKPNSVLWEVSKYPNWWVTSISSERGRHWSPWLVPASSALESEERAATQTTMHAEQAGFLLRHLLGCQSFSFKNQKKTKQKSTLVFMNTESYWVPRHTCL